VKKVAERLKLSVITIYITDNRDDMIAVASKYLGEFHPVENIFDFGLAIAKAVQAGKTDKNYSTGRNSKLCTIAARFSSTRS
jgi:hypothetical protein